jgi:transcriptional regulator with XRE-family HTH domain
MTEMLQYQRPVGDQLRQWRERRRLSQMDLALQAEVSTRHLSFVETGRSKPSREIILRLAERLDLPLRERNLVDGNSSIELFTAGCAPWLLESPANALQISLHPDGMASRVVNLGERRAHLLGQVRRQVELTRDLEVSELYEELRDYPCGQFAPDVEVPGPGSIFAPLRVRHQGRELVFFSTVATFGTPLGITVAELAIESFFPADEDTRAFLRGRVNSEPT